MFYELASLLGRPRPWHASTVYLSSTLHSAIHFTNTAATFSPVNNNLETRMSAMFSVSQNFDPAVGQRNMLPKVSKIPSRGFPSFAIFK